MGASAYKVGREIWVMRMIGNAKNRKWQHGLNTLDYVKNVDGQSVMFVPSPQCPEHWHVLGSTRCPQHKYCAVTEVCSACVISEG